jgi:hypothetical protein
MVSLKAMLSAIHFIDPTINGMAAKKRVVWNNKNLVLNK